ncbi:MAG: leucyl aminopeptidase [Chloroflexi bacterium]|nr:leucyl aminopeptidase [Chloroflexota bacterium]
MKIQVISTPMHMIQAEILLAGMFTAEELSAQPLNIEQWCGNAAIRTACTDFKAKACQTALIYPQTANVKRVLLVGLGEKDKCTLDTLRQAYGAAARAVAELGLTSLVVPIWQMRQYVPLEIAQTLVEAVILGSYTFNEHKSKASDQSLSDLELVTDSQNLAPAQQGAIAGQIIAESVCLARDLTNQPGNYLTPTMLAETAEKVAAETGLRSEVLDEAQMAELGMGAILGVAQGSEEAAKFVILEHNADKPDLPTYVVVGKGINFDSGGLQIKSADGMGAMKGDMTGAGDTLAILRCAALLKLPLHVVGLMPCTENMPDGHAYKPGDVLKSMSGQTIEIISTDAEGRLILADALTFAKRYQPKAVVDLATLTGACVIALGNSIAGLLCNNTNLTAALEKASAETGEKVWELPLEPEYEELLDSDVADMMNVGGRPAGTITAGLFLGRFTKDYPWAHLDIAGKEQTAKTAGYTIKGGTGYGVRLVTAWLRDMAESTK